MLSLQEQKCHSYFAFHHMLTLRLFFILDKRVTLTTDELYEEAPEITFEGCKLSLNKITSDRETDII